MGIELIKKGLFYLFLLILIFILNCSSAPEFHYYFLSYDLSPDYNTTPGFPYVLGIEKFDVDEVYNNENIIYRDSPYEIKYYVYRKWGSSPRDIVSEKALEHIRASGLFKSVRFYPDFYDIDYLLRGRIKSFEEWDEMDAWYAKFSIESEFIDIHKDSTLFVLKTEKMIKAESKDILSVVVSMSKCVQETFDDIIKKIDENLNKSF